MKKTLYLLIAILLVFTSVIALSSCNKNKSIDLTVDNINEYIIINVIEDEIQFEYVADYKHYFKNITVTTNSRIKAQYENLKITFDLEPSANWVPQSNKSIEADYTGKSETQFFVSAGLTKAGYVSPTPEYKVVVTQVEGKIIIE